MTLTAYQRECIARDAVDQVLEPLRYRRIKGIWVNREERSTAKVALESLRSGRSNDLNLGVMSLDVISVSNAIGYGFFDPDEPIPVVRHASAWLSFLAPQGNRAFPFVLPEDDELVERARALADALEDYGLPWIRRSRTLAGLTNFLVSAVDPRWELAALAACARGARDELECFLGRVLDPAWDESRLHSLSKQEFVQGLRAEFHRRHGSSGG